MTKHAAPLFFRPVDAPRLLGISRSTIYRWTKAGHIKMYKRGSMSFLRTSEVVAFICGREDDPGANEVGVYMAVGRKNTIEPRL